MNRVIAAFKKVRLRQILMTCLAGVLLFVSTACNSAGAKTGAGSTRQEVPAGLQSETGVQGNKNPRPEVPGGTATSPNRDVINSFQGGSMNEFSDVDPRAEQAGRAAADKAATLKKTAERNVIDQTSNVGENTRRILDKKGENVEDVRRNLNESTENTKYKAQNTADKLGKAAQQGAENVKDSTLNATKDTTRGVNRAAEDVKDNSRGAFSGLNRSASRVAEDAPELVQNKGNETAKNASIFVQDKVNQFARGTERTINKATDAVTDAVD